MSRSGVAASLIIAGAAAHALRQARHTRRQHATVSRRFDTSAPRPARDPRRVRRVLQHPGLWTAGLTAAVYTNQLLVTIYVTRVHGGNAHFIARYLPSGWFALPVDNRVLGWLAAHWPAPGLLAPSVLRVQAACELPLVVCVYLTVCWWLGADVYRQARAQVPAVCLWWTMVFALAEAVFRNPYTLQDLVLRALVAPATAMAVHRLGTPQDRGPQSAVGLLAFAASAGALGGLVLIVYDTALLYNLAHLPAQLPAAALCVGGLAAARVGARLHRAHEAGPRVRTLIDAVGRVLVVFFVAALPVRYGLVFNAQPAAAITAVTLAAAAGLSHGAQHRQHAHGVHLTPALAAGVGGAAVAYACAGGYPETRLLAALAGLLTTTTTASALLDRRDTGHAPDAADAVR